MRKNIIRFSIVIVHIWLVLTLYYISEEKKAMSIYKIEELKSLHRNKIQNLELLLYVSIGILGVFYLVKILQFIIGRNKFDRFN